MTFIYRSATNSEFKPPVNFRDLLDKRFVGQIALQDPHLSSAGLQFLNWVQTTQSSKTEEFLRALAPNVANVAPSWSFSYGLFKKQQVQLVFSYLTSLAFHWGFENDRGYQAVNFPEGHPVQVEFSGVLKSCKECELAVEFVQSLSDSDSQKLIMQKNFMLPVLSEVTQGTIYEELPKLKVLNKATHQGTNFSAWDGVFKH
jgi:thiamine transport system substrate-binding protein